LPRAGGEDEENESSSTSTTEVKIQSDTAIQVCSHLLEMFSTSLLRSHATVCLVDRDRLQLYHANRSVILVSSAINLSEGNGLDQFTSAKGKSTYFSHQPNLTDFAV
jgi:hypothetical protein